jgi:3-methyladenine DNA glycosylase AlkD
VSLVDRLERLFESARDDAKAADMARYMRDAFPFYGIPAPVQREIWRTALAGETRPTETQLRSVARGCWKRKEREWQYFACAYLRSNVRNASSGILPVVEQLITTKSWWDTIDTLAAHTVGPLVRRDPHLLETMDGWITSENFWLARTAILHQLHYKSDTDSDRLFDYCRRRAVDTEFFIRKAIGWALREYSKTDPHAVREFVREHPELSGLSKREALKRIERGGSSPRARN